MGLITPTDQSVLAFKGLHLYHAGVSNCSMRVRITLEEKGLPWTSHHLNIVKKEHITPDYFGINPNGLVPTLVHDGKVIIESDDIIEYLDKTFEEPSLRPKDGPEREYMESWLHRATAIHMKAVKTHIYEKRMRGKMTQSGEEKAQYEKLQKNESLLEFHRKSANGEFTQQELDQAKAVLDQSFADLEAALEGREWLAGDQFSLADIAWVPLFFTLRVLAGYSFDGLVNTAAWAERIEGRSSYKKAVLDWWPQTMTPMNEKSA
ncbi:MAG: glutathione S-transferase family protein [Pseudomonadota bacterium]